MQEDGRGKLIPLPVSFFSLLGQTGSGPDQKMHEACWVETGPTQSGPSSAQPFLVGLSPARLFGPAQPDLILNIIYYNML